MGIDGSYYWDLHIESSSNTKLTDYPDLTFMLLDDLRTDRETEARCIPAYAEAGTEDILQILRRYAATRIRELDRCVY
jgi:hypothetical protein